MLSYTSRTVKCATFCHVSTRNEGYFSRSQPKPKSKGDDRKKKPSGNGDQDPDDDDDDEDLSDAEIVRRYRQNGAEALRPGRTRKREARASDRPRRPKPGTCDELVTNS